MSDEYKKKDINYENPLVQKAVKLELDAEQMRLKPGSGISITKKYESAGDLYAKAGKFREAESCYRNARTYGDVFDEEYMSKLKEKENSLREDRGGTMRFKRLIELKRKSKDINSKLEKMILQKNIVALITITFLSVSLFFVSSNLTGFAISNLSNSNVQWIGFGFFVIGLIFAFVYFRKKKISKDL
jgi:hypothetical protein